MKLIKSLIASAFVLAATTGFSRAQTVTFDPSTNLLRIPSIQVGSMLYSNLVFRVEGGAVISVGVAQQAGSVADICTAANITLDRYNAIAIGMSMDQINSLLGCRYVTALIQRTTMYSVFGWTGTTGGTILVYFDPAGTQVTPLLGGTIFKSAIGL